METSRDTSQVPKAIMIAGVRAMMVLSGRFTRFTHAHAPSSVRTTRTVRQATKVEEEEEDERASVGHEADDVVAEGDANEGKVGRQREDGVQGQDDRHHLVGCTTQEVLRRT
jgi:hypothetical protein